MQASSGFWHVRFALYFLFAKFRKQIAKLNLSVTSICNSRCQSCEIWKEPKKSQSTDLTLDEYDRLFACAPKTVCWLSITGGEPFLREDLEAILTRALTHFPRLALISLTTNGLDPERPTPLLRNLLKQRRNLRLYLNISLDGVGEAHDEIRGVRGNFIAVGILREKLRKLEVDYPGRIKICFETTVSKLNVDALQEITDYAKQRDAVPMWTLGRASEFYRPNSWKDRKSPPPKNLFGGALLFQKAWAILSKLDMRWNPDGIMRRALSEGAFRYARRAQHPVPCVALKHSLVVSAKGDFFPCIHWRHSLGNARSDSTLNKIVSSSQRKKLLTAIKNQACPGCWTPCEATQSLMGSPLKALYLAFAWARNAKKKEMGTTEKENKGLQTLPASLS